jgi:hypothetical protein
MTIGGNSPDTSRYYSPSGPGINSVGSFQVSGRPFLTGTSLANNETLQINFPNVTKNIHFSCHTPAKYFRVYFDSPTANPVAYQAKNFTTVSGNISGAVDLEVKCDNLFLVNDCGATLELELRASITGIPVTSMFALSGSGINA